MTPEHRATAFVRRAVGLANDQPASDADWRRILHFADRTQLTLFLDDLAAPEWVRQELRIRAVKSHQRQSALWSAYAEIDSELRRAGVAFVLLKGFTHADYGLSAERRVQYDLDLLCAPPDSAAVVAALHRIGYKPHPGASLSDQHLPAMVRSGAEWAWNGDYYDPAIPVSVDVHTSVWNQETDRIRLAGVRGFWDRRCRYWFNDRPLPSLDPVDKLAFASLHALRHILRNDARPAGVLELAAGLEVLASDGGFWRRWALVHDEQLRTIQAVAFRFAVEWFGCSLPAEAAREDRCLPRRVTAWFEDYAWSPVTNLTRPNKDVLWLHLALLRSVRDRAVVLRRRLFPLRNGNEPRRERLIYHASALTPALASGVRFWRRAATASIFSQTRS